MPPLGRQTRKAAGETASQVAAEVAQPPGHGAEAGGTGAAPLMSRHRDITVNVDSAIQGPVNGRKLSAGPIIHKAHDTLLWLVTANLLLSFQIDIIGQLADSERTDIHE